MEDHEIDKETYVKLLRLIDKSGEVRLSKTSLKHGTSGFRLSVPDKQAVGGTVCRAIQYLYADMFPPEKKEIVVDGVTYIEKAPT